MDIMLEKILALIGNKHGEARTMVNSIGAPPNSVTEWKAGRSKSYRQYLPQIAEYYGVSLDWLSGNADKKEASAKETEANNDMADILQEFRENPELRTLFSLTKNATSAELRQYSSVIKALRGGGADE